MEAEWQWKTCPQNSKWEYFQLRIEFPSNTNQIGQYVKIFSDHFHISKKTQNSHVALFLGSLWNMYSNQKKNKSWTRKKQHPENRCSAQKRRPGFPDDGDVKTQDYSWAGKGLEASSPDQRKGRAPGGKTTMGKARAKRLLICLTALGEGILFLFRWGIWE